MEREIFSNISPLDARYYRSSSGLMEELCRFLSENSVIRYQALVEYAIINIMEKYGLAPSGSAAQMEKACQRITPEEVYAEEEKTRHNIRALVNVMQRYVTEDVAPFIHLSATSEDITGTAQSMRIKDAMFKVVIPRSLQLLESMLDIVEREAGTMQIGRTHGQHAVPITVGYMFSGYVDRFGGRVEKIADDARNLKGKLSGAVGAYNASSLLFKDPRRFEEEVLELLGLEPAQFSSQIVEPEYMLDLTHDIVSAFGILAQIADDLRNLQRTEIAEMGEAFGKGQVGSSTMPHKKNPWNFEHVKSMWKEFCPRIIARYFDQISEHQRDLTNSASSRFVPEIIAGFVLSVDRITRQFRKLVVDKMKLEENLSMSGGVYLAEPLYVLLASTGVKNAHEIVKQLALRSSQEKKSLVTVARTDERLKKVVELDQWKLLEKDSSQYCGKAKQRALDIAGIWREKTSTLKNLCTKYKEIGYE